MIRGRASRRLLVVVGSLFVALLVGESLARVDALFPGAAYDARSVRGDLETCARAADHGQHAEFAPRVSEALPADHRPVPDPWSGWTSPALIRRTAEGTRWFAGPSHAGTFDVVLLGGSVAAQFGNEHSEARIEELLGGAEGLGGRRVTLWNLSVAAQKQPSQLHRLTALLAMGWKPDLVVCLDGFNELVLAVDNAEAEVSPVQPAAAFWGALAQAGETDGETLDLLARMRAARGTLAARARLGLEVGVWRSALLARAWSAWMSGPRARLATARAELATRSTRDDARIAVRGPWVPAPRADAGGLPRGLRESVRAWAESARHLRWICDARGIPLVHAIQPALDDEGAKPASDEELRTHALHGSWPSSVRAGYPLLRASAAELEREGVLVHDATRHFAARTETLFTDGCHLNAIGNQLLGAAIWAWARVACAENGGPRDVRSAR